MIAQTGIAGGTEHVAPNKYKVDSTEPVLSFNGNIGFPVDSCEIAAWEVMSAKNRFETDTNTLAFHVNSYLCLVQINKVGKIFYSKGPGIGSDFRDCLLRCQKDDLIIFFDIKVSRGNSPERNIMSGPVYRVK